MNSQHCGKLSGKHIIAALLREGEHPHLWIHIGSRAGVRQVQSTALPGVWGFDALNSGITTVLLETEYAVPFMIDKHIGSF